MTNTKPVFHGSDIEKISEYYHIDQNSITNFAGNVNPLGLSPSVKEAVAAHVDLFSSYPDRDYKSLCNTIAEYCDVPADFILPGNGSSELISLLIETRAPKRTLILGPTYSEYSRELSFSGSTQDYYHLQEAEDFELDVEDLCRTLLNGYDFLILCNPNNPTGRTAQPELLREIVRKCTENGVKLVVDECFNDFLTDAERHTRKDLLESNPGLIILRAYTKMYAVPGVRFGWCMTADAALIEKLYHAGQPWNVSVIAQACAVAAANEPDWAAETAKRIAEERRFLSDGLAACGLTVFPGEANFLLFRSNDTGLHKKLAEHGIMIRNCDNYRGLSAGYYRVAVKTREASERLLQIITNYTQCEV